MKSHKASRLTVFLILLLMVVLASGCSWMGRTAGRAQAKAERNVEALEKGYKEGYESERGKTGTQHNGVDSADKHENTQQPR